MTVRVADGWVKVDCDAPDFAMVYIQLGDGEWRDAYRDYHGESRVAMVRPGNATGRVNVALRVGDDVTRLGSVKI
jgi:hypothetical protein